MYGSTQIANFAEILTKHKASSVLTSGYEFKSQYCHRATFGPVKKSLIL